ncbi:MAG: hypothetical protein A2Z34_03750 [Planctomycetes bacterium RBG_16_59_8]|nr:MAG: hypothetical protein A2Z34_03750 [Planctomycetes bacterium RBG_16_59_8]
MGLRINTNISSLRALRNLSINDRQQALSLERLSTGLRINRGSDDPSGLVISEQLRAQLAALNQAVDNSQNASNLVSIADAALTEIGNLLVTIQDSVVFAQNTGGNSPEQVTAEQDSVDQAITAINRIAATTRYSDREILNGNAGYVTTGSMPDAIDDLSIRSMTFASSQASRDFDVQIDRDPQRARIQLANASVVGETVIRIQGPRGTDTVLLASGSSETAIADAINSKAGFTGIFASGTATTLDLFSEGYGSEELIKIEILSGQISGGGASDVQVLTDDGTRAGALSATGVTQYSLDAGDSVTDTGLDGQVTVEGIAYTGTGREFNILSSTAQFTFRLDPEQIGSVSSATFTVLNSGMTFQLNEKPQETDRLQIGIINVATSALGLETYRDRVSESINGVSGGATSADWIIKGGFLNTLVTGGDNDLDTPDNAFTIVDEAIDQVSSLRGYLGAVQASNIQPNIDSLGVAIENLSASLSDLRDLDFAQETSNFTRTQILFQSGIAVLASANLIPQSILTLLS